VASSHTFAVILAKEIVLELPKGQMLLFVIPGLTRNPVLFQVLTFLDAGSGPA
jgi:hypothetical protein